MKRVFRLVFEHFGWKLLALGIAVLLWALVATEPELTTLATVRLEYKNLPENLEIGSEPPGEISLELRGPSGELRGVGATAFRPAVVLDMSDVRPGEHTFPIDKSDVKLPRGVELVRAIPSEVRLTFELTETRQIPVTVRFIGEGADGYVVANDSVEPAELTIVGPSSHVARTRTAITDPVNVSRAVGTEEFHVNAYVGDPFVRFRGSPQVTVRVTMAKK
jgi:YbbR domain-containing protein